MGEDLSLHVVGLYESIAFTMEPSFDKALKQFFAPPFSKYILMWYLAGLLSDVQCFRASKTSGAVHHSEIKGAYELIEGQKVKFEVQGTYRGPRAVNVKLIE